MADFLCIKQGSTTYDVKDVIARTELGNKVDKVEGKGLSTNDYTDADVERRLFGTYKLIYSKEEKENG